MKPAPPAAAPCVILGAGLAGLSCAYHLRDVSALLLEREGEVGGTARSFVRHGFGFDVTGHWLHLRTDAMRALVEKLCPGLFAPVRRRARVHHFGRNTPYPFQAHTHGLPKQVVADCLLGYFAARQQAASGQQPPPTSFADYVQQSMGAGIAQHFMLPYNEKLWTVPASALSHAWCGRFVPLPTPEEVVWGALQPAGSGRALGYNGTFLYPTKGGMGQLPLALAAAQPHPVRSGWDVAGLDLARREVLGAAGERQAFRLLVSTLPLPALVAAAQAVAPVPEDVAAAASVLRATQLTYWDVGLATPRPRAAHWTYFPGPEVPFFRVGSPSAVRPGLAPGGRSYCVEVSHGPEALAVTDADVLRGLRRVGLVAAQEQPLFMARQRLDCAYVIMDHAYGEARAQVLRWLAGHQVVTTGRFGAWTYDSMEGALLAGQQAAGRVRALWAASGPPPGGPARARRRPSAAAARPRAGGRAGFPSIARLR